MTTPVGKKEIREEQVFDMCAFSSFTVWTKFITNLSCLWSEYIFRHLFFFFATTVCLTLRRRISGSQVGRPPPPPRTLGVSGHINSIFRARRPSGFLRIHLDNLRTIRSGGLKHLSGPSIKVSGQIPSPPPATMSSDTPMPLNTLSIYWIHSWEESSESRSSVDVYSLIKVTKKLYCLTLGLHIVLIFTDLNGNESHGMNPTRKWLQSNVKFYASVQLSLWRQQHLPSDPVW